MTPTRHLQTMDINRETPATPLPPHPLDRKYDCPRCEHSFYVYHGLDTEICPGCDEDCTANK